MAIATCKKLAQHMEPLLWRHLYVRGLPPPHESILRNRHFIRCLYISGADSEDFILLSNSLLMVTNHQGNQAVSTRPIDTSSIVHSTENSPVLVLNRMQRIKTDISGFDNLLLPIFNRCSNLTHLELSTFIIDDEGLFIDSLRNNLRQLLHLSIRDLAGTVKLESALPLLHVCLLHPQLREIDFAFKIFVSERQDVGRDEWESRQYTSILEDLNNLNDSAGPFRPNITTLILPTYWYGYPFWFLEQLLKDHLNNIERFKVPMLRNHEEDLVNFDNDETIESYRGLCPKHQHLVCEFDDRNFDSCFMESFINGSYYGGGVGLKSCRIIFMEDDNNFDILYDLMDLFSDTLEEIDLVDCKMAAGDSLQHVFSMFDQLRRFRVTPSLGGVVDMRFPELLSEEWVCLELRELHLKLSRDSVFDNKATTMAQAMQMIEDVYTQIGRLVKLEELYLDYSDRFTELGTKDYKSDLTLELGFLDQLKGLSRLRHFHMVIDFWSSMGRAEVEFIHANWKNLEKISFGIPRLVGEVTVDRNRHWRWLKKQRPGLTFEYK